MVEPLIQLIVGLGNPGPRYELTRHNAGVWFIEKLLDTHPASLKIETRFHAKHGVIQSEFGAIRVAIPTTYMNESGLAVRALSQYYKIAPENILIAHDELDVAVGDCKLKKGGGHGGHNGLRDIQAQLQSKDVYRLKIGVARPKSSDEMVDYVLSKPSKSESLEIYRAIESAVAIMPMLWQGKTEAAMTALHTKS